MKTKKISQLPDAQGLTGVELFPLAQQNQTRKSTVNGIKDYIINQILNSLNIESSITDFFEAVDLIIGDTASIGIREHKKTISQRIQEGTVVIYNRGVISGCAGSKALSGRKVTLSGGGVFANGMELPCSGDNVWIIVPPNGSGSSQIIYYGYLSVNTDGSTSFLITGANEPIPSGGISICKITVPAGNTADDLSGVTLTDTRRYETAYPIVVNSLPYSSVALPFNMLDTNYAVFLDVVSHTGQRQETYAREKATNGFKVYIDGTMDAASVRWAAVKMNL